MNVFDKLTINSNLIFFSGGGGGGGVRNFFDKFKLTKNI